MARPAREGRRPRGRAALGRTGEVLASLVLLASGLIAALIVLGIVLVVLKANPHNTIVSNVHDAAKFFVGPFDDIFKQRDPKLAIAINWGIATFVYVIVGRLLARLLRLLDGLG